MQGMTNCQNSPSECPLWSRAIKQQWNRTGELTPTEPMDCTKALDFMLRSSLNSCKKYRIY